MRTPFAPSRAAQAPSEPSRGQEAPPSASTRASALRVNSPSGPIRRSAPDSAKPAKSWRVAIVTPSRDSRASQARRSGVALKLAGKTRPLEPMKVVSPSSAQKSRSACGGQARMNGAILAAAAP